MKLDSILLCLDGSSQSKWATEFCWQLAQAHKLQITAQHVVDSNGVWEFLAHDLPGLIGSGPYFGAHEVMTRELRVLGRTLLDAYETYASARNLTSQGILDEGNTISEICKRAKDHDLIVIGHRQAGISSPAEDRRLFPRLSVAERLVHYCPKPLLVVQGVVAPWARLSMVMAPGVGFPNSLLACLQLANFLSLPLFIHYCIQTSQDRESLERFSKTVSDAQKAVPGAQVAIESFESQGSYWMPDLESPEDSLVIVPMMEGTRLRLSSLGTEAELVIRHSASTSLLLWPENYNAERSERPSGSAGYALAE